MRLQQHDYATRPALLRKAIDAQQSWIEQKLGVPVSEAEIFETTFESVSPLAWRKFSAAVKQIPILLVLSAGLDLWSEPPKYHLAAHRY